MKILHVYKDYDPPVRGGVERHIALMCRYQKQWADVEALVCGRRLRTSTRTHEGVPITEVGEWGRFQSAPVSPMFPAYLRLRPADVLVVHVPNPTAEVAWLLTRPRGKLVVRYHSDVVRQASAMKFYGPVLLEFLRHARLVMPTSQPYIDTSSTLQALLTKVGEGVVRPVPLGIEVGDFQRPNQARVAELRARYGGATGVYVLFSGMHRYYKGLEFLIRAAGAIKAPLVVAGDGPESPAIRQLARDLGFPVHFPGALSDAELVDHLHGCTIFVFPSVERSEAFGLSMLEAQACGKPVVATRLGTGVEFVNMDGQTGLNVPPRDPAALAEAVNALLDDPERARHMGECARQRVEREFTAEATAAKEFALYREILG